MLGLTVNVNSRHSLFFFTSFIVWSQSQTSSCAINATQSNIKCSKVGFGRIVIVGLISFWFYKRNTKRNKKKNCLTPRQYISLWLRNGSTCRNIFYLMVNMTKMMSVLVFLVLERWLMKKNIIKSFNTVMTAATQLNIQGHIHFKIRRS